MSKFACAPALLLAATLLPEFGVMADDTNAHTNDALLRASLPISAGPDPQSGYSSDSNLPDIFQLETEGMQPSIGTQTTVPAAEQDELDIEGEGLADDAIAQVFAELDFQQATQSYLWALPLVAYAQWREEFRDKLGAYSGDLIELDSYEEKLGLITATPYILGFVDLNETGPLVIKLPPGAAAGGIGDLWQRVIIDMGQTGPDKGKGGKYLVLPPGTEPPTDADKYYLAKSETMNILVSLRVLDPNPSTGKALIERFKMYPYAMSAVPGKIKLLSTADKMWSGTQPQGMAYWERLHQIIQKEPVNERDRFDMAMLASLGIEQGKPFQPTYEQRKALEQGAQAGEMIANANIFATHALTAESPSKPLISVMQANPTDRETMKINDAESPNMSAR